MNRHKFLTRLLSGLLGGLLAGLLAVFAYYSWDTKDFHCVTDNIDYIRAHERQQKIRETYTAYKQLLLKGLAYHWVLQHYDVIGAILTNATLGSLFYTLARTRQAPIKCARVG
jgi:hypothetical protein